MKVSLTRPSGDVGVLTLSPSASVESLKSLITERFGLPPGFKLVHAGRLLSEDVEVQTYGEDANLLCLASDEELVTFATLKGKTFDLVLSPGDSIAAVKAKIQHLENYKKDRQRLVMSGQLLQNSGTVAGYGITTGTEVELLMPDDQIVWVADYLAGISAYCLAKDATSVASLKTKIEAKTGVSPSNQLLSYQGAKLQDDQPLSYLSTSTESPLTLKRKMTESVRIHRNNKTTDVYLASFSLSIGELKRSIETEMEITVAQQRLFVESEELTDESRPLSEVIRADHCLSLLLAEEEYFVVVFYNHPKLIVNFPQSRSIGGVKKKLEWVLKVPALSLRVFVGSDELQDDVSLEKLASKQELFVTTAEVATVLVKKMRTEDLFRVFLLMQNSTGLHVKKAIEKAMDIPAAFQYLVRNGEQVSDTSLLERDAYKDVFELHYLCDVLCGERIPASATNDPTVRFVTGKTYAKDVLSLTCRTVAELRSAVSHCLKGGEEAKLYCGEISLEGDSNLISSFGVRNLEEIDVVLPGEARVWVQPASLKPFSVITVLTCTVKALKQAIERDWNFLSKSMRLSFRCKELPEALTLTECGVQQNDVLQMRGDVGLAVSKPVHIRQKRRRPYRKERIGRRRLCRVSRPRGQGLRGRRFGIGYPTGHPTAPEADPLPEKTLKLIVIWPAEAPFRVNVSDLATVMALKTVISLRTGIAIEDQTLRLRKKVLINTWNLRQCSTKNYDFVRVQTPSDMLIHIHQEKVKSWVVLHKNESIRTLKDIALSDSRDIDSFQVAFHEVAVSDDARVSALGCSNSTVVTLTKLSTEDLTRKSQRFLFVSKEDGPTVRLSFSSEASTVADVNSKLFPVCKLKGPERELRLSGRALKNEEPLSAFWGQKLELMLKSNIQLSFEGEHLPTLHVTVKPGASVSSVKQALKKKYDFHFADITLVHNGVSLKNSATIQTSGIASGATLTLSLLRKLQLRVATMDGREVTLGVNAKDVVWTIKAMLQASGFVLEAVQVTAKGELLEDQHTLEFYGIEEHSQVELVPRNLMKTLSVSCYDLSFVLSVAPSTAIFQLKSLIFRRTGNAQSLQSLYFQRTPLKNSKKISDYNLPSEALITVLLGSMAPLFYKSLDGTSKKLMMEQTDNIGKLKASIQHKENLPYYPSLIFNGRVLSNDREILQHSKLSTKADIDIVRDSDFIINIEFHGLLSFRIDSESSVATLKAKIEQITSVAPQHQCLYYNKSELDDEKLSLSSCGVTSNSTIYLLQRVFDIRVEQNVTTLTFTVTMQTTVLQLKELITSKTQIPPRKQRLTCNQKRMSNKRPLSHYSLTQNSVVVLTEQKDIVLACQSPWYQMTEVNFSEKVGTLCGLNQHCIAVNRTIVDTNKTFAELGALTGDQLSYIRTSSLDLYVQRTNGKIIRIATLTNNHTIMDVKRAIETHEKIPRDKQTLVLDLSVYSDSTPLRICEQQETFELFLPEDNLFTVSTVDGDCTAVQFKDKSATVQQLKEVLRTRWDVSEAVQCLLLDDCILDDDMHLNSLPKRHLSLILVNEVVVYVNVLPQSRRVRLVVHFETSVRAILQSPIFGKLTTQGDCILKHHDDTLPETLLLSDCQVPFGGTLDLFVSAVMTIRVVTEDSLLHSVAVARGDSLRELRSQLAIPSAHLVVYDGRVLAEDQPLSSQGVVCGASLSCHSVGSFLRVSLLAYREAMGVLVPASARVLDVKAAVEKAYGIPKSEQRYVQDRQYLPDASPFPKDGSVYLLRVNDELVTLVDGSRKVDLVVRDAENDEDLLSEIERVWGEDNNRAILWDTPVDKLATGMQIKVGTRQEEHRLYQSRG